MDVEWFDRPGGDPVVLHPPTGDSRELAADRAAAIERDLATLGPRAAQVGSTVVPG